MSLRRTERQNGSASVWQGFLYDWQVHPDQTKAVKGQNSKTLVTTGIIERPLPCPIQRTEKQGTFSQRKRKSRVRGKEKKIRTKTERKRKEN